jgi:ABC-type cobalamin/Fe3+-siderophores transport system ATPase subunit
LIFFLLADKSTVPLILDQPEENLDNQTIHNVLVPMITNAKKKRQVIIVTHNPNLAVVCDSEQIIYSEFSSTDFPKIKYIVGSIENPVINEKLVNILEGTMPAFRAYDNTYFKF